MDSSWHQRNTINILTFGRPRYYLVTYFFNSSYRYRVIVALNQNNIPLNNFYCILKQNQTWTPVFIGKSNLNAVLQGFSWLSPSSTTDTDCKLVVNSTTKKVSKIQIQKELFGTEFKLNLSQNLISRFK